MDECGCLSGEKERPWRVISMVCSVLVAEGDGGTEGEGGVIIVPKWEHR